MAVVLDNEGNTWGEDFYPFEKTQVNIKYISICGFFKQNCLIIIMKPAIVVFAIVLLLVIGYYMNCKVTCSKKEKLTGYGVISGLAANNNPQYCVPPNPSIGYSGGCFIPHRVIV